MHRLLDNTLANIFHVLNKQWLADEEIQGEKFTATMMLEERRYTSHPAAVLTRSPQASTP